MGLMVGSALSFVKLFHWEVVLLSIRFACGQYGRAIGAFLTGPYPRVSIPLHLMPQFSIHIRRFH
jgi:hypothetical protein